MANYIFYSDEGYTISPTGDELESLQILGFENSSNFKEGIKQLLKNNPWIEESGFSIEAIKYHLILDNNTVNDLKSVIDYLSDDEKRHFEKSEKPENHIFSTLERLKALL